MLLKQKRATPTGITLLENLISRSGYSSVLLYLAYE